MKTEPRFEELLTKLECNYSVDKDPDVTQGECGTENCQKLVVGTDICPACITRELTVVIGSTRAKALVEMTSKRFNLIAECYAICDYKDDPILKVVK